MHTGIKKIDTQMKTTSSST